VKDKNRRLTALVAHKTRIAGREDCAGRVHHEGFGIMPGPWSGHPNSKVYARYRGEPIEDLIDYLNHRGDTPSGQRIIALLDHFTAAEQKAPIVKTMVTETGKPHDREAQDEIATKAEFDAEVRAVENAFTRYNLSFGIKLSLHGGTPGEKSSLSWMFDLYPRIADDEAEPLFKWELAEANWPQQLRMVYRVTECDAALMAAAFGVAGDAARIRRCEVCKNWFYARTLLAKRCSQQCTDRKLFEDPQFKKSRAQYMKEYRKGIRRRQPQAEQAASSTTPPTRQRTRTLYFDVPDDVDVKTVLTKGNVESLVRKHKKTAGEDDDVDLHIKKTPKKPSKTRKRPS
jgi:hypothetical protein